jgi:hypothetical protein
MPVVTVAPNDALLEKLKSNMQEVRARGGVLYVLADADTNIESSEGARDPHARALRRSVTHPARGAAATAGLPHRLRARHGCGQAAQPGQERDGGMTGALLAAQPPRVAPKWRGLTPPRSEVMWRHKPGSLAKSVTVE